MKVYLVMTGYYEQYGFSKAFVSRDFADEYILQRMAKSPDWAESKSRDFYEVIEADVETAVAVA